MSPPDTKDVCTDTDGDSGVGSLSACVWPEPEDGVRARLLSMSQASHDDEDKECLSRVVALIDGLEALSRDHSFAPGPEEEEEKARLQVSIGNKGRWQLWRVIVDRSASPMKQLKRYKCPVKIVAQKKSLETVLAQRQISVNRRQCTKFSQLLLPRPLTVDTRRAPHRQPVAGK